MDSYVNNFMDIDRIVSLSRIKKLNVDYLTVKVLIGDPCNEFIREMSIIIKLILNIFFIKITFKNR